MTTVLVSHASNLPYSLCVCRLPIQNATTFFVYQLAPKKPGSALVPRTLLASIAPGGWEDYAASAKVYVYNTHTLHTHTHTHTSIFDGDRLQVHIQGPGYSKCVPTTLDTPSAYPGTWIFIVGIQVPGYSKCVSTTLDTPSAYPELDTPSAYPGTWILQVSIQEPGYE